jgi:hypothetical protein
MALGINHKVSAIFAAALCGCATQPIPTSDARQVSADRVLEKSYFETKPGAAEVIVKRDSGFLGAACAARVFIDAVPVMDLMPSEKAVLHLEPGDHIFSVQTTGRGLCRDSNTPEFRGSIAAGKVTTLRIAIEMGGAAIYPTAF